MREHPLRLGLEHEWWKGNFPTWIVVILLAIIGWMARREVGVNDKFHAELAITTQNHLVRISILESKYKTINESLSRIESVTREKLDTLIGLKGKP